MASSRRKSRICRALNWTNVQVCGSNFQPIQFVMKQAPQSWVLAATELPCSPWLQGRYMPLTTPRRIRYRPPSLRRPTWLRSPWRARPGLRLRGRFSDAPGCRVVDNPAVCILLDEEVWLVAGDGGCHRVIGNVSSVPESICFCRPGTDSKA